MQVISDDVVDNIIKVCHSNSYEKLQATVQVCVPISRSFHRDLYWWFKGCDSNFDVNIY